MTTFLIILGIIAGGYLIYAYLNEVFPFAKKTVAAIDNREQAIITTLTHVTPPVANLFPKVLSRAELSPEVKQGVIDAFSERIIAAVRRGWASGLEPASYTLYIFPAVEPGVFKVFLPPGDPYIGSQFDKGGWMLSAEKVITKGETLLDEFIIAASDSRTDTANYVSYALDHLFAYKNDRDLYEKTKFHSEGVVHPLW